MSFEPELDIMLRTLRLAGGLDSIIENGQHDGLGEDVVQAILTEAGKISSDLFRPLAEKADQFGAKLDDANVTTAPGYKDAIKALGEGGWIGLGAPEAFGGQAMPQLLSLALFELLHAGDPSLSMGPLLSTSAIEALIAHAPSELQSIYLPKLISGEWYGTMNLTEASAGSDLGLLTSKAVPQSNGSFAITGQKIFITCGEHDFAENIVHLVLARLPGAPTGSKGISLFIVPKFLPDAQGLPGKRNAVQAVGMEEKMGLHASPTMVMDYDGATGWLIGEENRGLACMFTMMNIARVHVGIQAVGIAQSAYQHALAYTKERKQGKHPGLASPVPIIHHADVQHMLLDTQAHIRAARAICYATSGAGDMARYAGDPESAARHKRREEFLTPIAKAWSSDMAVAKTATTCQIWGGMGFIEESGAPRYYRDAKITTIYEGTNGIQALDLVGRKLSMQGGLLAKEMIEDLSRWSAGISDQQTQLEQGIEALSLATDHLQALKKMMKARRNMLRLHI